MTFPVSVPAPDGKKPKTIPMLADMKKNICFFNPSLISERFNPVLPSKSLKFACGLLKSICGISKIQGNVNEIKMIQIKYFASSCMNRHKAATFQIITESSK